MRLAMCFSAAALLAFSAGCGTVAGGRALPVSATPSSAAAAAIRGPSSLEFRKVVANATRAGVAGAGSPPSPNARQSRDEPEQLAALRAIDCTPGTTDPLAGHDDRARPLVTCGRGENVAYLLEPEFLPGSEVAEATSGYDEQRGQWLVNLKFKSEGTKTWADFTSKNINQQVAFVVDSQVLSAPNIQIAILDGVTTISGKFTEQSARELADRIAGR
ncbi:precorrin-3B C(17)-methyltransferase [Amycolatopsis sp. DG1A-15b]|uniref:SecDF P1 head subdomain-containing protein n=1 Tax=Amycolatopsis sp. DG1A-15b TaxID=3052846 RepID=UPI00255BDF3C|nr:precorrin-3B C(17)-methyltransferase [Amycolatopsis sp. DG1A-15b]WIX89514.1 precorrin-3B C(17)-methyltransferase [Amycolatopsis sp. DG1A-15b]